MTKIPKKSQHKKQLEKVEQKAAADKKAIEDIEAAKKHANDEMRRLLDLVAAQAEVIKRNYPRRTPPTPGRLKAMARRYFMMISSKDPYERMYFDNMLQLVNRLDSEHHKLFFDMIKELEANV